MEERDVEESDEADNKTIVVDMPKLPSLCKQYEQVVMEGKRERKRKRFFDD